MTNQLKVGIVGAHRGSSYVAPFKAIVETDMTAVCDINEETLQSVAERFDIPQQFTDYAAMLDAVDIVVLATPENLHVPQAIEALEAGKHVISEVTAAVKLEECYDLVRAVRKSSAKYTMAGKHVLLQIKCPDSQYGGDGHVRRCLFRRGGIPS